MAQIVKLDSTGYPPKAMSVDAELSVIGSFMSDVEIYRKNADKIDGTMFCSQQTRIVYRHIEKLFSAGESIDPISVDNSLAEADESEKIGGIAALLEMVRGSIPSAVPSHINKLKRCKMQRAVIDMTRVMLTQSMTSPEDAVNAFVDAGHGIERMLEETTGATMPMFIGSEGADLDVDWLIEGFVPAESFGVVYGPGGGGKTFHVIDWACSIASGMAWDGNESEMGNVVYVATEGRSAFGGRIKAWEIANGTKLDNLYRPKISFTLGDATLRSRLINTCEQIRKDTDNPVRLVVFDTLNRVFDGNENATDDMTRFVQACDEIKSRTGATVMVVHHSGKDETKGARGSTVLRNALDFEYMVKGVVSASGMAYQLQCTKMKDAEEPSAVEYGLSKIDLGTKDKKGKMRTSLARTSSGIKPRQQAEPGTKEDKLLSIINSLLATSDHLHSKFLKDEYISKSMREDKTLKRDAAAKQFDRALKKLCDFEVIRVDLQGNVYFID